MAEEIWYVDDDPMPQAIAKVVLRDYPLKLFSNPEEVLKSISTQEPRLLITDYEMPEMSGGDLINAVRKKRPELNILLVSSITDLEDVARSLKVAHLKKPFIPSGLLGAVKQLLG